MNPLSITDLQRRVVAYARQATARGLISTGRLATLCGWSQPYMQLVITGDRDCTPHVADSIIQALGITAADLFTVAELQDLAREEPGR